MALAACNDLVGAFNLERLTKEVSRLATSATGLAYSSRLPEGDDDLPPPGGTRETEEFITTRLDIPGGPDVIAVQRK
jgi:hypothetical protein